MFITSNVSGGASSVCFLLLAFALAVYYVLHKCSVVSEIGTAPECVCACAVGLDDLRVLLFYVRQFIDCIVGRVVL